MSMLEKARNLRKRKNKPFCYDKDGKQEIWDTLTAGGKFRMTREEMLTRTRQNWMKLPDVEVKFWLEKGLK